MKRIRLVAIIAALIAGVGIYQLLQDISKPREIPRTEVVVAVKDIPENTVITEEMVMLSPVVTEALLPHVIKDPKSVIGKVLSSKVYAGEQITVSRIVQEDQTDALSYRITPGMRAISLAVSQVTGVSYMIKPEDNVDIIMTYPYEVTVEKETEAEEDEDFYRETEEEEKEIVTYSRYLLQNVRVLAVNAVMKKTGASEYVTVTLEVTPEEALNVTNIDSQFNLRLVLRNGLDGGCFDPLDVDLSTITGRGEEP